MLKKLNALTFFLFYFTIFDFLLCTLKIIIIIIIITIIIIIITKDIIHVQCQR